MTVAADDQQSPAHFHNCIIDMYLRADIRRLLFGHSLCYSSLALGVSPRLVGQGQVKLVSTDS